MLAAKPGASRSRHLLDSSALPSPGSRRITLPRDSGSSHMTPLTGILTKPAGLTTVKVCPLTGLTTLWDNNDEPVPTIDLDFTLIALETPDVDGSSY